MNVQITAKSLSLALVKAGAELGVTQDAIRYDVVEKKEGFLGFFGNSITIKAWCEKRQEVFPITEEAEQIADRMRDFCSQLCTKMLGKSTKVKSWFEKDRIVFDIRDDKAAKIFESNPKLFESFEHILRKFPGNLKKILPHRIFVDAGGQRKGREEELLQIAADLSDKVCDTNRPVVLNYKSPYDRKIIHMALDQDERVYTKSIGTGQNRKLMIIPSKMKKENVDYR